MICQHLIITIYHSVVPLMLRCIHPSMILILPSQPPLLPMRGAREGIGNTMVVSNRPKLGAMHRGA